jgi:hypothetical protein
MIRSLRLADAALLLLFLGKSPVDEARTRSRLNDRGLELAALVPLIRSCLMAQDARHSYICIRGGFIQAMACLQSCRGHSAWEVERLLLIPGREECGLDLLEKLGSFRDEIEAGRLFLRLRSDSPVVDVARQAGFSQYLTELLYQLGDGSRAAPRESSLSLREKAGDDEYRLFRLYTATVPVQVRTVAGMTYDEWSQSRDRGTVKELILEEGGEVTGWLRLRNNGKTGQFDIIGDLGADEMTELVDYSLSALQGKNPVYCIVPEYQPQLQRMLEEAGLNQVAEFLCMSKELMERVREPQLVPLSA